MNFSLQKPYQSILFFVLIVLLIQILGNFTSFSDKIFPFVNQFFTSILHTLTSKIPFSLGDWLYGIGLILGLIFLTRFFIFLSKKKYKIVKVQISRFFYLLSFIYFSFHICWAFNYYKTPIKDSYAIESIGEDELKFWTNNYLIKCKEFREMVPEDSCGVFLLDLNQDEVSHTIMKSKNRFQKKYSQIKFSNNSFPNLKPSLYSSSFSYLGILGYYNPFTSEAQFNACSPDTKLLFSQFHETSHGWGFATESEANFVGFLVGSESENYAFQYVSNYMALRSLLNKLVWIDPKFVQLVLANYSDGMMRDRQDELENQERYNHRADDAFAMLNDAYLKLNNQEGLESYGKFVELLIGFNRKYTKVKN